MFLQLLGQLTFLYKLCCFYLFGDIFFGHLSFLDFFFFFGIKNNLAESWCLLGLSRKIKYLIQMILELSAVQTNRNFVD